MIKLTITTSEALSGEEKARIEKSFASKYGRLRATYHINEGLIGGIIVFDGEKVYDGSIRTQLDNLLDNLKERIKI